MRARAIVQVMLSVDVGDSWGDNCTVEQVRKQAIEGAEGKLTKLLQSTENGTPDNRHIKYIRNTAKAVITLEE